MGHARVKNGFPTAGAGQAVGLLGGSFDPPHEGHVHITRHALVRFGLDRVWWLVSPGNPLKPEGPAPMSRRMDAAAAMMQHPRVNITDIEARIGTRYTADTVARLQALYPRVRFVWLMGADNLAGFHRWDRWEEIMARVPVGVLARPGVWLPTLNAPAARRFAPVRLPAEKARLLPRSTPPAWCHVTLPLRADSSSAIRARGEWVR